MTSNQIKTTIVDLLQEKSTKEKIEIIANVLIEIGFEHIDAESKKISIKNITQIVLKDVKKHGDTLPNSLVRQGLSMLLWLKK